MDIKGSISEKEENLLYEIADEFQRNSETQIKCPRCEGKLNFIGGMSAYRISCVNNCGIVFSVRGI